jgi:hypothetical protein
MAFKQVRVHPAVGSGTTYADNDIFFALTKIELPISGPCLLRNITIIDGSKQDADALDMQLLFLNNNDDAIGTVNGGTVSLTALNASRRAIGFTHFESTTQSADADFDNFNLCSTTDNALTTSFNNPIVLEPEAGSRDVYFTAVLNGGAPAVAVGADSGVDVYAVSQANQNWVACNGTCCFQSDYAQTIDVDQTDPTTVFKIGDSVTKADGSFVGVIASMTKSGGYDDKATITFEEPIAVNVCNDNPLHYGNVITFLFDFEY